MTSPAPGGEISGNTGNNDAGGVYVAGTFTMKGGTITGNTAEENYDDTGAEVYVPSPVRV